jgi:hypothetical protein
VTVFYELDTIFASRPQHPCIEIIRNPKARTGDQGIQQPFHGDGQPPVLRLDPDAEEADDAQIEPLRDRSPAPTSA